MVGKILNAYMRTVGINGKGLENNQNVTENAMVSCHILISR